MKQIFSLFLVFFLLTQFSKSLEFKPLNAYPFEPRIGTLYNMDDKKLRLDIGNSIDLFDVYKNNNNKIVFGTDFTTYTRLRSEGNLKFPVETSDYLFGVNFSGSSLVYGNKIDYRLRVSHISSHVVDGLSKDSILYKLPFVYSREFVDFVISKKYISGTLDNNDSLKKNISNSYPDLISSGLIFRPYIGFLGIFSTQPKGVNPFVPHIGFDLDYQFDNRFSIKSGYDFRAVGSDNKYYGANAAQLGVFYRTAKEIENKNGIFLGVYYYSGKSIHGMFFNDYDKYLGLGFQVYFY